MDTLNLRQFLWRTVPVHYPASWTSAIPYSASWLSFLLEYRSLLSHFRRFPADSAVTARCWLGRATPAGHHTGNEAKCGSNVISALFFPSCFVLVFRVLRITATSLISLWRTRLDSCFKRTQLNSLSRPTRGSPCVWVRWSTASCSLVPTPAPFPSASIHLKWVELWCQVTPCWG